jgi:ATP-dependent Clp protease ATP-binding subunit ClpC
MHERFSDRARHAMALANQEAGRMKHNYLAPAHILMGLIAEGNCVATEALRVLQVNLETVRDQVVRDLGQGNSVGEVGLRAQTEETRKMIAKAVEEARKLGHRYIGTEHLMLALIDLDGSLPAKVLRAQGVDSNQLRSKLTGLLSAQVEPGHDLEHSRHGDFEWAHQQELAKAFRSPSFWHTLILAVDAANRQGAGEIEPQHLLMALLRDQGDRVAKLLESKGVTLDWVRDQLSNRNAS